MENRRVYYIPANVKYEGMESGSFFSRLQQEVSQAFPEGSGFLQLKDFTIPYGVSNMSRDVCYYGVALGGIIGDVESNGYRCPLTEWKPEYARTLLLMEQDSGKQIGRRICGGILRMEEFARFKRDWKVQYQNRALQETHIVVIDGNKVLTVQKWNRIPPLYYIPVHRCQHDENADWSRRLYELLRLGFLPVVDSDDYRSLTGGTSFMKWLHAFYENTVHGGADNVAALVCPDEETVSKTLDEIRAEDYKRARIPKYSDEFFQVDRGFWDLWPYAQYGPENPPPESGNWIDISDWKKELYARDPRKDIAESGEWAAIDFGTWSTMVAVWQENAIHLRRIGMQEERNRNKGQYENPTVLKFHQVDAFLEAYRNPARLGRPDTEFSQIMTANAAKEEFQQTITSDGDFDRIMQFQDQLKQWVNDPIRTIYTKYQGQWHDLKYASLDQEAPDPVEIYAYYIGLYLNNMHHGKIYLKYLLSYSATYCKGNLDRLRESFERGLRKSLPEEVAGDEELMEGFEVRLYLDEATAYATTALLHYREQAVAVQEGKCDITDGGNLPILEQYIKAMQDGGLFYGVYDFGGGTLDYSFGRMSRRNGQDVITPLERGGVSDSGCENLLENLAYRIFSDNRDKLINKKIHCFAPSWLANTVDNLLVGRSAAARVNTLQLMDKLRELWVHNELDNEISFRLMAEDGSIYDAVLPRKGGKTTMANKAGAKNGQGNDQADDDQQNERSEPGGQKSIQLDSKCDRTAFFEERIREGVRLFLWQFQYTAIRHGIGGDKMRFIFLGGSASKSERVWKIFDEEIRKEEGMRCYYLHRPLSTKYDEAKKEENPDISVPNAKSGVVYGLLTARPDAPGVWVDSREMSFCYFQYHLGRRVPDEISYSIAGRFALLASASDLAPDVYCHIGEVPLGGNMELLYTRRPEYGFPREDRELLSAEPVSATMIPVAPWSTGGYHIYCRPAERSDIVLELWISYRSEARIADEREMEELIGLFYFLPTPCFRPMDPSNGGDAAIK